MPIILIIKYMFIANAYLMMLVVCYYFISILYFFSKFNHSLVKDIFELHLFFVFIQMLIHVNQILFYIKHKILMLLNQIYWPIIALFYNNMILYILQFNPFSKLMLHF